MQSATVGPRHHDAARRGSPPRSGEELLSPVAALTAAYALPAALLLFITFLALARLIALRARADVLVDGHWLSALARAQRRMGFKHGTALLISNDLSSPISWGLMRPVEESGSCIAGEEARPAAALLVHRTVQGEAHPEKMGRREGPKCDCRSASSTCSSRP